MCVERVRIAAGEQWMERLGRYLLVEPIASGGMAEVFRAVAVGEAGFARPVAVKRILPHLTREPAVIAMLVEEARIASSLSHRNVVRVLDLGQENGTYFIVMEFIAGQPLSSILTRAEERGERIPLQLGFHVAQEALEGLRYVHELKDIQGNPLNLIHRDISPQNIMVTYDGAVLVVDFGIAKAADRASLTQAGTLKGKPGYMSPEVVKGLAITQSMDLYAMGVVMHEMITMQPLRTPRSPLQMLAEVRKGGFPRFDDMGCAVPEEAADFIYKALAPDPSDRWANAAEMGERLKEIRRKEGWLWSASDVAGWMHRMFPEEVRGEDAARGRAHNATMRMVSPPATELGLPPPAMVPTEPALGAGEQLTWWKRKRVGIASLAAAGVMGAAALLTTTTPHAEPARAVFAPEPEFVATVPEREPASLPVEETRVDADAEQQTVTASVVEEPPPAPQPRQKEKEKEREKRAAARPQKALLSLQSRPWAKVILDGKDTGLFTPVVDLPVSPGTHSVELVNPAMNLATKFSVKAAAGARVKEARQLR